LKVLVATDAWHPQVNGVVHTLGHVAREARALGAELEFLSPDQFWALPMPSYPEIRLALVGPRDVERRLDAIRPDAVHIATDGPIGHAMRADLGLASPFSCTRCNRDGGDTDTGL